MGTCPTRHRDSTNTHGSYGRQTASWMGTIFCVMRHACPPLRSWRAMTKCRNPVCQDGYIATTDRAKVLGRRSTEVTRNGRTWNSLLRGTKTRTRFGMDINDDGGMRVRARRQMCCGHALLRSRPSIRPCRLGLRPLVGALVSHDLRCRPEILARLHGGTSHQAFVRLHRCGHPRFFYAE